jgi:hypothetical protein
MTLAIVASSRIKDRFSSKASSEPASGLLDIRSRINVSSSQVAASEAWKLASKAHDERYPD